MLQLADGTQFECEFFGLSSVGILYIDLVGVSLADAINTFTNAEKTNHMVYEAGGETVVRDSFTVCLGANLPSVDLNNVRISMRKPYSDEVNNNG